MEFIYLPILKVKGTYTFAVMGPVDIIAGLYVDFIAAEMEASLKISLVLFAIVA